MTTDSPCVASHGNQTLKAGSFCPRQKFSSVAQPNLACLLQVLLFFALLIPAQKR